MTFIIPGYPNIVSNTIETPDIAELLMYPIFKVAEAETVRKYGTDFQKKLIDLCPLKNERKRVTVHSSVDLLDPQTRAMTGISRRSIPGEEWHIDGIETGQEYDHFDPVETIHLFIAHAEARTKFADRDFEFDDTFKEMTRRQFNEHIQNECRRSILKYKKRLIIGKMIKKNTIYTFTNHLHSASAPQKLEFRFTFRVRETDRDDIPSINKQINTRNRINHMDLGRISNVSKFNSEIRIFYPSAIWNYHNKKA